MMMQANSSVMPPIYPPTTGQVGLKATGAVRTNGMMVPAAPPMPPPVTIQQEFKFKLEQNKVCHFDGCSREAKFTCNRTGPLRNSEIKQTGCYKRMCSQHKSTKSFESQSNGKRRGTFDPNICLDCEQRTLE